jgi:polyferredoxin
MSSQLTENEFQRLKRWERRMVGLFIAAMIALLAVTLLTLVFRLTGQVLTTIFIALIAIFVIPGFILQFSERCPRCGSRLGFQTRLTLPDKCKRCGTSFKPQN